MARGYIKHVFAGGNTPLGFFSYYDYIISPTANRIFILKGSPGTGKSTFMKKVAEAMLNRGYSVEFHHSPSDNNSLDGLVIPSLDVALIAGTAPHIVDPRYPGCVDEIIHLGDFSNESRIIQYKQKIINCSLEISKNFKRAYRMLKAAKTIFDDWEAANIDAMDYAIANSKTNQLSTLLFSGTHSTGAGRLRKLFASAITPEGSVSYLDSIVGSAAKHYTITGHPGTGKSTLLQNILETAILKGLDVEAFYCPLDPYKVEHLIILPLQTAIVTSTEPHIYPADNAAMSINMNDCLNSSNLTGNALVTSYDKEMFWLLFNKAVSYISTAKKLNDELETYYVPNMDFPRIQKLLEYTIERILSSVKKSE